jgi:hypothetical protein
MKSLLLKAVIIVAGVCALGACDHAKSRSQVAKDTNAAEQQASERLAKAEQNAEQKEADAQKDVNKERRDAAHETAVQEEKVSETQAEGEHKVALARCEALSGDAQKSCKDQADADYDIAKAKASLGRAQSDPKP